MILDNQTGHIVKRSPEQQQKALHLWGLFQQSTFLSALVLREIKQSKHYLDLGCESWEDFCNSKLPFSRSQAFRLISVADRLAPYLMLNTDGNVAPVQHFDPEEPQALLLTEGGVQLNTEMVEGLGMRKLYEMTTLPTEDLDQLMSGGYITTAEGEQVSIAEIREMATKESSAIFKSQKEKYQARLSQAEEEIKALKAENKTIKEQQKAEEAKLKLAKSIEQKYGALNLQSENLLNLMAQVRGHLLEANKIAIRIKLTDDVPEIVAEEARKLAQDFHASAYNFNQRNYAIIDLAADRFENPFDE
jgi:hypothetical protein